MRIILLIFLMTYMPVVLAESYYVAPGGNNSGQGNITNPFLTISYGLTKLKPGDILYLRGGIYHEKVTVNISGTQENRITISGYPGEKAIIDGEYTLPGGNIYYFLVKVTGSWITLRDMTITRSNGSLLHIGGTGTYAINITGIGSWTTGMIAAGEDNIIEGCTMTDSGNHYGIDGQTRWGSAIVTAGKNTIIQNCVTYDNKGEGLNARVGAVNAIIQDCISYNNGAVNLYIDSSTGTTVRRNLVYATTGARYSPAYGITIGAEQAMPSYITIVNNLCIGNYANLHTDTNVTEADNWKIANNTFVNARGNYDRGYRMGVYFRSSLTSFTNSIFMNNIIIEDEVSARYPISVPASHPGFTFSNNLWNETPASAAQGSGDIIGNPGLTRIGNVAAGELTGDYFKLQNGSVAINKGTVIPQVTDDFFGNMRDANPDIGGYEYPGGTTAVKVTAVKITGAGGANTISSAKGTLQLACEITPLNATIKTVTWSLTNNTGQATISSSGLVTAVSDGTVTAKATANDGSGISGTFMISISNQAVAPDPVYINSVVRDNTPSLLEVTFNQILATAIPEVTSFTVQVNQSPRVIKQIAISGAKVILTLDSPVNYGDKVTIAYTKPLSDPLKSAAGGMVGSFSAQQAANEVKADNTPPVVVVKYVASTYSGFVNELDAGNSYDGNNDKLTFTWIIPDQIAVSATTGPKIQFLCPIVNTARNIEFVVEVTDGKTAVSKQIPVEILPYNPELEIAEILSVEASGFLNPNYPYNIIDGNIGTAWTAEGDGQWLLLELKEEFRVQHVKLAFRPGQKRQYYFDILGSDDLIAWDQILSKSSSCAFSGDLQVFDFPASKTEQKFRYIKIIVHGNSIDNSNCISEFRIFGYRNKNPAGYEKQIVKIYPNPVHDYVTVKIDDETLNPESLKIINMSGFAVLNKTLSPSDKEIKINLNLKTGYYTLLLIGKGNVTLEAKPLIVGK